jgi:hypothetical protein
MSGRLPDKQAPATTDGRPTDEAQRNLTDPQSSIMVGADGFVQAYNAQLAVDEGHQIIVARGVSNQPPDSHHLLPMLKRVQHALDAVPEHTRATRDTGTRQSSSAHASWARRRGWPPRAPDTVMRRHRRVRASRPHNSRHWSGCVFDLTRPKVERYTPDARRWLNPSTARSSMPGGFVSFHSEGLWR